MGSPPANANATRGANFRAALARPGTVAALVLGPSLALLLGAAVAGFAGALAAPVAVALTIVALAWRWADRRAESEFWGQVAQRLGYRFTFEASLLPLTPLLGAGDRRVFEHTLAGPLADLGFEVRLAHYRFDVRRHDSNSHTTTWEPHPFTVCVAELVSGMELFPGVYLRAHRGPLAKLRTDWLRGRHLRSVELESTAFNAAYDLQVSPEQDDARLRELFAPATIEWFAEHPLRPQLEFRAGTLVVYVPDHVEDIGHLVWLLDATADIARRFLAEVAEDSAAA